MKRQKNRTAQTTARHFFCIVSFFFLVSSSALLRYSLGRKFLDSWLLCSTQPTRLSLASVSTTNSPSDLGKTKIGEVINFFLSSSTISRFLILDLNLLSSPFFSLVLREASTFEKFGTNRQ